MHRHALLYAVETAALTMLLNKERRRDVALVGFLARAVMMSEFARECGVKVEMQSFSGEARSSVERKAKNRWRLDVIDPVTLQCIKLDSKRPMISTLRSFFTVAEVWFYKWAPTVTQGLNAALARHVVDEFDFPEGVESTAFFTVAFGSLPTRMTPQLVAATLCAAVWSSQPDVFDLMLKFATQESLTMGWWAPLQAASCHSTSRYIHILYCHFPKLVSDSLLQCRVYNPPCLTACEMGNLGVVRWMHEKMSYSFSTTNGFGWTAMHAAAYSGHMDVVQYLADTVGADPTVRTNSESTPGDIAFQEGHRQLSDYLLKKEQERLDRLAAEDPDEGADQGRATLPGGDVAAQLDAYYNDYGDSDAENGASG